MNLKRTRSLLEKTGSCVSLSTLRGLEPQRSTRKNTHSCSERESASLQLKSKLSPIFTSSSSILAPLNRPLKVFNNLNLETTAGAPECLRSIQEEDSSRPPTRCTARTRGMDKAEAMFSPDKKNKRPRTSKNRRSKKIPLVITKNDHDQTKISKYATDSKKARLVSSLDEGFLNLFN